MNNDPADNRRIQRLFSFTFTALLIVFGAMLVNSVACTKKIPIHPGAISNLDSYSYDVLLAESAVLTQARQDYANRQLPNTTKPFINKAIAQYNIAQAAWHAYHENHAANETALQDALNALVGAVGQLQQVLGKAPAPLPESPTSQLVPLWRHA